MRQKTKKIVEKKKRDETKNKNNSTILYCIPYNKLYDNVAQVPDDEADVAVLEEPEHLNFFRAERVPWLKKFE